jgi:tetratricopeptide (TPR) repeat protein
MDARLQRLWERGMAHFRVGNFVAAQGAFDAMLALDPRSVPALYRLSLLQARQGRFRAALDLVQRAAEREPERVDLLVHLARCRLMTGRPESARAIATRALALPRDNASLLDSLGVVMTRLDEQALAIELFDQAIELQPDLPSLYFNRALAQRLFGQLSGAERDLEKCVALQANHGKAHWALAEMLPRGPVDNHVVRLRAQLPLAAKGTLQEEMFALALFRELDDMGQYEEAWPMLERGIASRRGRWLAAGQDPRAVSDALLHACNGSFPIPEAVRTKVAPLFVFGMPGSGVALLGKLLSRHSKVHHLGALSPFSRLLSEAIGRDSIAPFDAAAVARFRDIDFEALGREYLAAVTPAAGARELLVCESRPMNYQLLPLIARALPNARFLHMTRDPLDNCVSILAHPGGEGSLPTHEPGRLVSSYLDYRRLMLHWGERLPGRIMEVSYDSLVERPETVLRVVCASVGLRYASGLRTGLMLHSRGIGRGSRYYQRLPALAALS